MKCCICGRKLINPQSQELGYGPVCYKREFGNYPRINYGKKETSSQNVDTDFNIPGQITIEEYLSNVFVE